jgi:hypothetical protein
LNLRPLAPRPALCGDWLPSVNIRCDLRKRAQQLLLDLAAVSPLGWTSALVNVQYASRQSDLRYQSMHTAQIGRLGRTLCKPLTRGRVAGPCCRFPQARKELVAPMGTGRVFFHHLSEEVRDLSLTCILGITDILTVVVPALERVVLHRDQVVPPCPGPRAPARSGRCRSCRHRRRAVTSTRSGGPARRR